MPDRTASPRHLRRLRWRIAAVLSGLLVTAGILTQSAATLAVGAGSMEWTGSRWEDPVCDTTGEQFDVRLYRDINYQGTQWRMCSGNGHGNFCWSPYGQDSPSSALCLSAGYDGETVNDYPSSVKVVAVNGGSACRVKIFENAGQTGFALVYWDPVNVANLGVLGDAASSIKRDCS